jgi:hypothetical protein
LSEDVVFDDGVDGILHNFDSVVLTCDPTDEHIAAFCSGVNDDVRFPWAWATLIVGFTTWQKDYLPYTEILGFKTVDQTHLT